MLPTLRINFCDFWAGFDPHNNYFWQTLGTQFRLVLSDEPELLFCSVYGDTHRTRFPRACVRVCFSAENRRPDFDTFDFAIGFDYNQDPRYYRLPLYAIWTDYGSLSELTLPKPSAEELLKTKTHFCCFVVSNPNCPQRNDFFHLLSRYKHIDSGGRHLNNIGYVLPVEEKRSFLSRYKFAVTFENESYEGYTTEKIFEPFVTNTVPIYWGNPSVANEFNPHSFVNVHDFDSMEQAVEHIIKIDNDDQLYLQYALSPALHDNSVNPAFRPEQVLTFLSRAAHTAQDPQYRAVYSPPSKLRQLLGKLLNKN